MKPELTFASQIKVIVINEEWSEYGGTLVISKQRQDTERHFAYE